MLMLSIGFQREWCSAEAPTRVCLSYDPVCLSNQRSPQAVGLLVHRVKCGPACHCLCADGFQMLLLHTKCSQSSMSFHMQSREFVCLCQCTSVLPTRDVPGSPSMFTSRVRVLTRQTCSHTFKILNCSHPFTRRFV